MAISWDTSACSVPLPQNDDEAAQRDTLIFLAARVEAGDLTPDTLREWMVRVLLMEKFGDMSPVFGSDQGLREALHRWCGLRTNAAVVPRGEWLAGWNMGLVERVESRVDSVIEEAAMFVPLGTVGSL